MLCCVVHVCHMGKEFEFYLSVLIVSVNITLRMFELYFSNFSMIFLYLLMRKA